MGSRPMERKTKMHRMIISIIVIETYKIPKFSCQNLTPYTHQITETFKRLSVTSPNNISRIWARFGYLVCFDSVAALISCFCLVS